jgi:hypothetical protein
MDKLDQYFQNTIEKIKELRRNNRYAEAIEIIEQEISSSYIPLRFVQTFEQLYVEISKEQMIKDIKDKFNRMSKTELLGNIFKDNKLDLNLLSYFLSKFSKEIDQYDLHFIGKIFVDKKLSNNEKIFILNQLKVANVQFDFTYLNNITNEHFQINSTSNFEIEHQEYYQQVYRLLDRDLMKDPSFIILAKDLLQLIYEHFFNRIPIKYTSEVLTTNLVVYVKKHFDSSLKVDNEFTK